jgi:hypothetical protein
MIEQRKHEDKYFKMENIIGKAWSIYLFVYNTILYLNCSMQWNCTSAAQNRLCLLSIYQYMILIIPVVSHSIEMGSSSFSAAEETHPTGATVVWDDSNTKLILRTDHKWGISVMVCNVTFNNISVISWRWTTSECLGYTECPSTNESIIPVYDMRRQGNANSRWLWLAYYRYICMMSHIDRHWWWWCKINI